jgi:murein DD-endopeptidase MepM/ murein hydrolase activator NlpD
VSVHPALLLPFGAVLAVALGTCVAPVSAQSGAARPAPRPAAAPRTPPPLPASPEITLGSPTVSQGDLIRGTVRPAQTAIAINGALIPVAPDGRFLFGVDRDANGEVVVEMRPAGRRAIERRFAIQPRAWNIQNINAPMRGAARSDADFERRRPGELAQMGAARRTVVSSTGWQQRFIWPVRGRISGVFGSQRVYQGVPGSYHNGVDVAAPAGTPYVAPADGVVILAATQPFTLEGYLLMIDHGGGLSSTFLHSSRLDVRTGDVVRQGQRLGTVGATGRATGPHMHWAMRWNGAKVDAQRFAGPM